MATFDYVEARAVAEELINEFGDPLQLTLPGEDAGRDPYGRPTAGTAATVIDGICSPLLDYKDGLKETNGSEIIMGDKFCYYHSDTNPVIGMELTANG